MENHICFAIQKNSSKLPFYLWEIIRYWLYTRKDQMQDHRLGQLLDFDKALSQRSFNLKN